MARGYIGAISNYKGGTGKTVTAVNLSASLSIRKKRVLLIDNDPQSDATRAVMQDNSTIDSCLYDLQEGTSSPMDREFRSQPPLQADEER